MDPSVSSAAQPRAADGQSLQDNNAQLQTAGSSLLFFQGASLVAQMEKNLPAVQETWAQSLGWEDVLEKGMATHSSILAWGIPWTEEPGGLHGATKSRTRLSTHTFFLKSMI